MRITFESSSSSTGVKSKLGAAAMNMSLEDVIKANQAKNPQQRQQQQQQQGNNSNNKKAFNTNARRGQGGNNTNNTRQQQQQQQHQQPQRQFPRQKNKPFQQGYGGNQRPPLMGPKPPLMGMRPPMYLTKSSGKLSISNLDPGVTEADMYTLFSEFGEIKEAAIHFDRNGKSLGSAHIIFEQYGDAVRGMQRYNGITLDGRPMAMHIEKLPGPPGTFKITPQVNSLMGGGAKPVKRLQKGPQQQIGNMKQIGKQQFGNNKQAGKQQMGNIKQVQNNRAANNNQTVNNKQTMNKQTQNNNQKANNKQIINIQTKKKAMPQQQSGIMKWPANMQMGYGISKGYSFGVPAGGVGLLQGTGSLTGLARPGVLGRLDGVSSQGLLGHSPGYQTAPSVLDRLDGGVQINNYVGQKKPLMPNPPVLSRLGGTVGGTSSSGSVFNRMGPKQGIAQHGKTTAPVTAVAGQQWSFAIPGGLAVTQKKIGNQPQAKNKQHIINQQQGQGNKQNKQVQQQGQKRKETQQQGKNKKKIPTAEELDAELDDYLREMNSKK